MALKDDLNLGLVSLVRQGMSGDAPKNLEGIYAIDPTKQELAAGIKEKTQNLDTPTYAIPGFDKYSYAARNYGALPSMYELYLSGGFPEQTAATDTTPGTTTPSASSGDGGAGTGATIPGAINTVVRPEVSDPFLASGAEGGARLPDQVQSWGAKQWEDAKNDFISTGRDIGNIFTSLKNKGIDLGRMAGSAIMNMVVPGAGFLMNMLPSESPIDKFNSEYALGGDLYENVIDKVEDPKFEGRLEGYGKDLIAGTGEGKDPFGINTVSMFGDYPKYATKTYTDIVAKEKAGKKLSQFDKDRLEYYGHVSGLTGKTNIPGTPLMVGDTDTADVDTIDNIFDDIDTGVGEFDTTPTPDPSPPTGTGGPTGQDIHGGGGAPKDTGPSKSFDPGGGFVDQGGGGEFGATTGTGTELRSDPDYGQFARRQQATSSGGGGGNSGGCFLKGTQVTMADGSTKAVEQVDLGDNVAKGGKVFAVGKFLINDLYDYKGVKVAGSHMVSEDGNWVRVEDSKHGKALGDDEHTVYVFGSENRRILINDILFTDYFEVTDQEKLLKYEDKFFDSWRSYSKNEDINNVNTLNAS